MDPVSVGAGLFGILVAAGQVTAALTSFLKKTKRAPKLAHSVLFEVKGLSVIVTHLQRHLLDPATFSRPGASVLLIEQIVVTLRECMAVFSDLEEVLGSNQQDGNIQVLERIKLAFEERRMSHIQERLQSNKSSLTLMLTILQRCVHLRYLRARSFADP